MIRNLRLKYHTINLWSIEKKTSAYFFPSSWANPRKAFLGTEEEVGASLGLSLDVEGTNGLVLTFSVTWGCFSEDLKRCDFTPTDGFVLSSCKGVLGNKDKNLDEPDSTGFDGNTLDELGQAKEDGLVIGEFEKLGAAEAKAANVVSFFEKGANDFSELDKSWFPLSQDNTLVTTLLVLVGDSVCVFGGLVLSRVKAGGSFKLMSGRGDFTEVGDLTETGDFMEDDESSVAGDFT